MPNPVTEAEWKDLVESRKTILALRDRAKHEFLNAKAKLDGYENDLRTIESIMLTEVFDAHQG